MATCCDGTRRHGRTFPRPGWPRPRPLQYRHRRRKRPPHRPGETTQGQSCQPFRLPVQIAPSPALGSADGRPKPQNSPEEMGDERANRKKNSVAPLQGSQGSRQRRGTRCPAPSGQTCPNFDECGRARKNPPIACANMEALHCALLGNSFRRYGAGFRNVDKTKSAVLILALIVSDLCPTQGAGTIKEHCGLGKPWRHADLLAYLLIVQSSVNQHRSFTNVCLIPDLSNEEFGHVRARDEPVAPLRGIGKNPVAAGPRSTGQNSRPRDRPIQFAFLDQFLL